MKKRIISFLFCLTVLFTLAFGDDEYKVYVDEEYYGTYLPVSVINEVEKTKNFEKAKYSLTNNCHGALCLGIDDHCFAESHYHDGYAIKKKYFDYYKFEYRGNDLYIIDNNGNEYKRISKNPGIYTEVPNYVLNEVFSCVKDLKNVDIVGNELVIEGKGSYSIDLDSNFVNTGDALLLLGPALKTEGMSGGLYHLSEEGNSISSCVSDEEFIHFPLLSYEPLIPLEEMSPKELRLYRNLQFARHGYKFKSQDLQEIFSQFEWYEPKSSNSGIKLTEEEQAIVDKCLVLEQQNKKPLPKNNIIDLSDEKKKNFMAGVWYDRIPGKVNPYGYVFFYNGTFEYKDLVTDKGNKENFISCEGVWTIENDYIYVRIDSYKEKDLDYKTKEEIIKTTSLSHSSFFKIGELTTFETDDKKNPYKVDLCPIISYVVQKDNVRTFYHSKEDSENLQNIDFYNAEKFASGIALKYTDYFESFFKGDKYKVKVLSEYGKPLFIARSFINEKKNIAKKGVIYHLNKGVMDILLIFDKGTVSNSNDILYKTPGSNHTYWDVNISNHEFIDAPFIKVTALSPSNNSIIETRCFEPNVKDIYVLCNNDKNGKPISYFKPTSKPFTNEVIQLPLGTDGTHGKDVKYVLFGDWPQSVKSKYVTVSNKMEKVHGFDAYRGSDGYYYVKVKGDDIYVSKFSTGEVTDSDKEYYFKIESIKWRVLDNDYQGGKLLLSEIPVAPVIFGNRHKDGRIINNKHIASNNYKYSNARAYLNSLDGTSYKEDNFTSSGFLARAFSTEAKEKIKTVNVDNSLESQRDSLNKEKQVNKYYCEDTEDKVFILSTNEVTREEWGFNSDFEARDKNRMISTTDYTATVGVRSYWNQNVNWYVRSPHIIDNFEDRGDESINKVGITGQLNDPIWAWEEDIGLVPAIVVEF